MFLPIPKPIRKILTILRGGVSPVIIFISLLLGFTFGLIPGFSGLHVFLMGKSEVDEEYLPLRGL